jgi:hypothetical protein
MGGNEVLDKTNWLTALAMILTTVACSDPPSPPARDVGTADTADGGLADALTTRDEPDIVTDDEVVFGRVPPNTDDPGWEGGWRRTTVQNVGEAPLVIEDIYVTGSDNFRVTYPTQGAEVGDVSSDTESWPGTLAPDASFDVRVWFRPDDNLPESGQLVFETNDPDESISAVELSANAGFPCLELLPSDEVHLGEGAPGQVLRETVALRNCSRSKPLELEDIGIRNDDSGVFYVEEAETPFVLAPGERARFDVVASIVDDGGPYRAELLIQSSDPANARVRLPVLAFGVSHTDCPFAHAVAWTEDNRAPRTVLETAPLTVVEFDGSRSFDSNGSVERYEWTVLSRPHGSTQRLVPANDVVSPRLFIDVVGTYEVALEAYDGDGNASCNERQVIEIRAVSEDDVYIELVWDTPADPDPADNFGSDVDLHYLHPHGRWDEPPYDVFWRNPSPDWGDFGDASDDPSFARDDTEGAGPEVVTHNGLESLSYRIGVYYYSDKTLGSSEATVRVYLRGSLEWVYPAKELGQTGAFWEVATIEGPDGIITPVDEMYEGFPEE